MKTIYLQCETSSKHTFILFASLNCSMLVSDKMIHLSASSSWFTGETRHFEVLWLYRAKKASLSNSVHIKLLSQAFEELPHFSYSLSIYHVVCKPSNLFFFFLPLRLVLLCSTFPSLAWLKLSDRVSVIARIGPLCFGNPHAREPYSNLSAFLLKLIKKKI